MEKHFFQQHPGTTPSSPSAELNGPQGAVKKEISVFLHGVHMFISSHLHKVNVVNFYS